MDIDVYQNETLKTYIGDGSFTEQIEYAALGLCGEAGEVANLIKKIRRDHYGTIPPDIGENLLKELGDCLWYLSVLAALLEYSLDAVADANIKKLRDRAQRDVIRGSGDDR